MKKIYLLIVFILLVVSPYGCAPKKGTLSKEQIDEIRVKMINADYGTTFRAVQKALENKGYKIDKAEKEKGIIFTRLKPMNPILRSKRDAYGTKIISAGPEETKLIIEYYRMLITPYTGLVNDPNLSAQEYENKINEMHEIVIKTLNE